MGGVAKVIKKVTGGGEKPKAKPRVVETAEVSDPEMTKSTMEDRELSSARRSRRGRSAGYRSLMSDSRTDTLGGGSKLG